MMPKEIDTKPMGRSPTRGYGVTSDGISFLLREYRKNGGAVRTGLCRIPKDQDDALEVVKLILRHTHGELAAQAVLLSLTK